MGKISWLLPADARILSFRKAAGKRATTRLLSHLGRRRGKRAATSWRVHWGRRRRKPAATHLV